jgi:hypothetical protein
MNLSYEMIQKAAALKADPDGYLADVARMGNRVDDMVEMTQAVYQEIRNRHPTLNPSVMEMAANFTGAMARWAKAGFATVGGQAYEARFATCKGCDKWDGNANAGMGKCRACGCSVLKLWLKTERCPLSKWPDLIKEK